MIGSIVLLYEDGSSAPAPAIVTGVRQDYAGNPGSIALELVALSADFDVAVASGDPGREPIYGDRVIARAVLATRGQPGKDSGTFWAPVA